MALTISRILSNYHLVLTALSFLILFFLIIDDSISFYVYGRFYEGFMLIWQVAVCGLFNLLLIIPYLIKADYSRLGKTIVILVLLILISAAGFKIPLAILPIISVGLALYYLTLANKLNLSNRGKIVKREKSTLKKFKPGSINPLNKNGSFVDTSGYDSD